MKKQLFRLALLATLIVGGSVAASAQVYVTVRPTFAPVARPVAPGPRHVWVDEDWEYRGGHYVAVGGHWVEPPHAGYIWVPGRWIHYRRGWQWRPGHWRHR